MGTLLLKGKDVAKQINAEISTKVEELKKNGIIPTLGIIWAGEDIETLSYISSIEKACISAGISLIQRKFYETIDERRFLNEFNAINEDPAINGIIVMRPLPPQIMETKIAEQIRAEKDIDCISPVNIARVFSGSGDGFAPCTAESVMEILEYYNVEPEGKETVIIGRSMVIGRPVAMMLLSKNATVTVCHSKTKGLLDIARRADILIAALGKPNFVNRNFIKEGAVVIDVGINELDDEIVGDVNFDDAVGLAGMITPVPGGVGLVTTGVLLRNVLKAVSLQRNCLLDP